LATAKQTMLFPGGVQKPVNVASVPQRSPFRYPGGKTWFVPTFRRWMGQKAPKLPYLRAWSLKLSWLS